MKKMIMGLSLRKRMNNFKVVTNVMEVALFFALVVGCAGTKATQQTSKPASSEAAVTIPAFELAAPEKQEEREYLGLDERKSFSIAQIGADVIIIEFFNMYCPHCQKEASQVNELYQTILNRPELSDKIKIIGIGIGNSPFEVNVFREKFAVPFPLFADEEMAIAREVGVKGTPTFVGMKNDGSREAFYFKSGSFGSVADFLNNVIALSGITTEI